LIDVCICTHNPRIEVLRDVVSSIANQQVDGGAIRVLIVDNASTPPVSESILRPLVDKGIAARIIIEPTPGVARARLRAIEETEDEWLLFVDDDNILDANYIAEGIDFGRRFPELGCFGGKLLLPPDSCVSGWVVPFLPYLAIKDAGEKPLFGTGEAWDISEPPTAGAFIRRSVLERYRRQAESAKVFKLGRVGSTNLGSCEDSLMMRGVFGLGLSTGYNPKMILEHRLDPKRFNPWYLIRLMYAYGISHVRLDVLIKGDHQIPVYYLSTRHFVRLLAGGIKNGSRQSLAFGLGLAAYYLGCRTEHLRQTAAG
jgi:glycosyltransferase involved in cell wall biosynthesis